MAITKDEVSKEIKLDLPSNLPADVKADIQAEVGEFLVESILDYVGDGRSPVTGQQFKQLSKAYADEEKGGRRTPNLDLEGDMLNSLTFKPTKSGVEVGIYDDSQAIKAYGHITGFEGHPWLEGVAPARPFIPGTKGNFAGKIMEGVQEIVNKRLAEEPEFQETRMEPRRSPLDDEDLPDRVVSSQSAFDRLIRGLLDGEG